MADDPLSGLDNINMSNMSELGSIIGKMKYDLMGSKDYAEGLRKAASDNTTFARSLSSEYTKTKDNLEKALELSERLGTSYITRDQIKRQKDAADSRKKQLTAELGALSDQLKKIDGRKTIEAQIQKFQTETRNLTGEALEDYMKQGSAETKRLVASSIALKENLKTTEQTDKILDHINSNLELGNDQYDKMQLKGTGLKKVLSSIANIPIIGPLINWQRVADKVTEGNGAATKELGSQFKNLWNEPFVKGLIGGYILTKLYDTFKAYIKVIAEIDKGVTTLSNNLGMSKDAGAALYDTFGHISWDTIWGNKGMVSGLDKSFMSIRNMLNATTELQDSLGSNAMMTENRIENEILLTKQMKFSTEEAANFQRLSLISGKSADSILQTTIKQNTAGLSYRKILKDVANISSEISMRYANDPEAIAKAVVQANKLGMSLEQTKKISDSLLNFEQSIEGELESELLLGKQLNYEHARELALQGKTAEAAGEILKQVGGVAALDKMNVIQRERLAASIGMSAEELSKAAIQEEVIKNLNFENVDALKERVKTLQEHNDLAGIAALQAEAAKVQGGQVLLQDIAKASMADKYEETMNKLKDILGNVLAHSTAIKIAFVSLTTLAAAFAASMMASAIAALVISGGTLAIGAAIGVGVLTAAAGGAAMYAVSDSVTAPGGNTISMPKGTLLPDKNDYVYTSTNPLPTGNGGGDNLVASKIDELIGHVKKGGNVYIDSTRSGTAYGMSYNSYA